MDKKKSKYISKKVNFGKTEFILYSIDGTTWSSRKDELHIIQERQEAARLKLISNMGEAKAQEEVEIKAVPVAEKAASDAPLIVAPDAVEDIDLDDEVDSEAEAGDDVEAVGKIKDDEDASEPKSKVKAKKVGGKRPPARVAFVTPKPRQIEKKKKRSGTKNKKRAAA